MKKGLLFLVDGHYISGIVLKELGQKIKTLAQRASFEEAEIPFIYVIISVCLRFDVAPSFQLKKLFII